MRKSRSAERAANMPMEIIKGALIASLVSMVLIVIYAFVLKKGLIGSASIPVANSAIKMAGAIVASLVAIRKCRSKRFLIGAIAGAVYSLVAFLVFSALSGSFGISLALLSDIGMCALAGMLCALILPLVK